MTTTKNDFGWAIQALKDGNRVARAGWNGKGVWQPGWLASQADMLAEDWDLAGAA